MSYLTKATAICLFTTLSITSYAQSIESAIKKEVASKVNILNVNERKITLDAGYAQDEAFKYDTEGQKIVMKDINSDGIKDAIVLLYYCEKTNCHMTTKSVDLVVFKGLGKNQFTKLGSASLGLKAKINSINNGVINVVSYDYGKTDPGCCPEKETKKSYKIKNGKLAKIK